MKKEQRVVYVQGIDSIAAVLYSEYYERDWLVVPMLRQIYNKYLRNFLDGEGNLCFKYSSLMVKRLLRYYDPELVEHFREIEFTANLYPLVNWIMTLFAHSVPLIKGQLTQIWTSIFSQQSLEYFFYLAVAIFIHSKPTLLPLDLNDTLQLISHLGSIIDVPQVLEMADRLQTKTPQSFVQNDLIGPSQHKLDLSQILKDSAYFQDRWWELDQLDYNESFDICLLSAEDYLKRKSMLTIDIRPWSEFHACHIRGSYHMREMHVEFIRCYRENYGDNVIVVVGDRETPGHTFIQELLALESSISKICMLRGGIDAIKMEGMQVLRKGQKNARAEDFTQQYDKFVKKAVQLKAKK
ncbi:hypothetical protein FGO68_gene2242 [Halteria grandinella]|uniref:TBC1 domain family member 23 n=1 Tax=Halteria grandinella TaxID=5974 RepID=A0A8J8P0I3_HALGN|nr:hypothetical protein FGO68_gene2242 [Halteria grandinella]